MQAHKETNGEEGAGGHLKRYGLDEAAPQQRLLNGDLVAVRARAVRIVRAAGRLIGQVLQQPWKPIYTHM